jgi:hypothetical protein
VSSRTRAVVTLMRSSSLTETARSSEDACAQRPCLVCGIGRFVRGAAVRRHPTAPVGVNALSAAGGCGAGARSIPFESRLPEQRGDGCPPQARSRVAR